MPPVQENPEQEGTHADEQACGERISYWLKKFGCTMIPIIELRAGQVIARIDIQKIPPDVLKELKKQERGQSPSA